MSLKINLCGGKLLEVPCSHVGHMFRAHTKSRKHESGIDFETFNRKRVVETWFDDFKQYVYLRQKEKYERMDVGDLSAAKIFRDQLKCKSFDYFVQVIVPDYLEHFPLFQFPFASGRIKLIDENLCLHINGFVGDEEKVKVFLQKCEDVLITNQNFELSWYRDIRLKDINVCLDAFDISALTCKHAVS